MFGLNIDAQHDGDDNYCAQGIEYDMNCIKATGYRRRGKLTGPVDTYQFVNTLT